MFKEIIVLSFSIVGVLNSKVYFSEYDKVAAYLPQKLPDWSECITLDPNEPCPLREGLLRFYLYTRTTQDEPYELSPNNTEPDPYDASNPTFVIIHGFTQGGKDAFPNRELRNAYFEQGDYNIISVDWSELTKPHCYITAAANVKPVGRCVTYFIENLLKAKGDIKPEDIRLIGFSLGAHVAGNTGRTLSFKLERITAIEPAGPLYSCHYLLYKDRINRYDAKVVDVYHANAGFRGLGVKEQIGTVDVYFNNGVVQPGCTVSQTSCSHERAVLYFAESINANSESEEFFGYRCASTWHFWLGFCQPPPADNWYIVGEHLDYKNMVQGSYFVSTNIVPPYAKGKPSNV